MKNNLSLLLIITFFMVIFNLSCRKDTSGSIEIDKKITITTAKKIFSNQTKAEGISNKNISALIDWEHNEVSGELDTNIVFKAPINVKKKNGELVYLIIVKSKDKYEVFYQQIQHKSLNSTNLSFTGNIILRTLKGKIRAIKNYEFGRLNLESILPPKKSIKESKNAKAVNGGDCCEMMPITVFVYRAGTSQITCSFVVKFYVCADSAPSTGEIYQNLVKSKCDNPSDLNQRATQIRSLIEQKSMDLGAYCSNSGGNGPGDPDWVDPDAPTTSPQDIINKTTDPCISKTMNEVLNANESMIGVMRDIIKKFDDTKTVGITVYDGDIYYKDNNGQSTGIPKPGETTRQSLNGLTFTADITLGKEFHEGTSKENLVTTAIHELVHAYLFYTGNTLLTSQESHVVFSEKYITPMASYLKDYFNIPLKDAYALAWSGVPDSKVFNANTPPDTEYTMSDGNKITAGEIGAISGLYKLSTLDPSNIGYAKGTKICD